MAAAQRNAFVDSAAGVLKCHGYVDSNEPGDVKIAVTEDFDKDPGKWKTADSGTTWTAYP